MNLIEALKTGKAIRRPIAKHWGSNRSGYLDRDYVIHLLTSERSDSHYENHYKLINEVDLLAEDWSVKDD